MFSSRTVSILSAGTVLPSQLFAVTGHGPGSFDDVSADTCAL